jgi:Cu(I)/Ag(I) efflux system membrane fusion protein
LAGLDQVWVEAEVYESDLDLIEQGDSVRITLPYSPAGELQGQVAFVYPYLDDTTRTGRVRIELANPDLALKPDMYANVELEKSLGERLVVPEDAILYAGLRSFVFLDLGEGRLRPKAVELGRKTADFIEVTQGLEEGDRVVTSGNFLVAAESRLKRDMEHWQ